MRELKRISDAASPLQLYHEAILSSPADPFVKSIPEAAAAGMSASIEKMITDASADAKAKADLIM